MKAVVFDFDETLTRNSPNIWRSIWQNLGYPTDKNSYYVELYMQFINEEITHQQWNVLTCEAFKQQNMNRSLLDKLAKDITLIDGIDETMQTLKSNGFSLHIVSGNIDTVIEDVLGDKAKYFDSINANKFLYNDENKLSYIIPTKYDFQGKSQFVSELIDKNGIRPSDIYYIGDGPNDEWVYETGCNTLCLNPTTPNFNNKRIWNNTIHNSSNLTDILSIVLTKDFNRDR